MPRSLAIAAAIVAGSLICSVGQSQQLNSEDIAEDAIVSKHIRDKSIRSRDIKDNNIHSKDIRDNTISSRDIRNNSVGSKDIKNGTLTADDLGQGAVGTNELQDEAVTNSKIGFGAVDTPEIANEAITPEKLSGDVFQILSPSASATVLGNIPIPPSQAVAVLTLARPQAADPTEGFIEMPFDGRLMGYRYAAGRA